MSIRRLIIAGGVLAALAPQFAFAQNSVGVTWASSLDPMFTDSRVKELDLRLLPVGNNSGAPVFFQAGNISGHLTYTGLSGISASPVMMRGYDGSLYRDPVLTASVGEVRINFTSVQNYLGMRWGDLSNNTKISFFNGMQFLYDLSGSQIRAQGQIVANDYRSRDVAFNFAELGYTSVVITANKSTPFEAAGLRFGGAQAQPFRLLSEVVVAEPVAPAPIPAGGLAGLLVCAAFFGWRRIGWRRMIAQPVAAG